MMTENKQEDFASSFSLVKFILKNWKLFIIVCAAVALLSFLFSTPLFIKPKYESVALIYAPRTNAVAKVLLNQENYNERLDVKAYGTADETEQMIQILNTRELKDIIIRKFNLITHYAVDTTSRHWKSDLYGMFDNNCRIKRTEFGAISISVMDTDPLFAAEMANEIVAQLDSVKNGIERKRAEAAYVLLKRQLDDINMEIRKIDDSLSMIMAQGVFDFESQSERYMQQRAIAVAQGNNAAVQRLDAELTKLATWGPTAVTLREHLILFREYQVLCKQRMMDAKVDMDCPMPVKFELQKAVPADKKAYPKKLTIVLVATVSAFVITLVVLLFMERFACLRKKNDEEPLTE